MANWISSKLKAAETILQQIDQQAAGSLGKVEKSPVDDDLSFDSPANGSGGVSLKDQLKKKTQESSNADKRKLHTDQSLAISSTISGHNRNEGYGLPKEVVGSSKPSPKPKATLTDSDWTQLLGTPSQPATSAAAVPGRGNGASGIRGLRKDGKKQGSVASASTVSEARRNQRGNASVSRSAGKMGRAEGKTVNGKSGDGDDSGLSDSAGRSSDVKIQSDAQNVKGRELENKEEVMRPFVMSKDKGNGEIDGPFDSDKLSSKGSVEAVIGDSAAKILSVSGKVDGVSEKKSQAVDGCDRLRSNIVKKHESSTVASRSSTSDDLKRGSSSVSYGSSDSDSDSESSSDSEVEREREERRKRREKILAEKAAARAVEAIKERENKVARLEGEKQSLEKILEEQTKQQAQEASKLQTSMMETMEAVELEKQKHNTTRMEALPRLAKLETVNAELARSLATMQWNLELEVNRVAEIRQQIDLKEVHIEELRRNISGTQLSGASVKKLAALKGAELEREILEAEYGFVTDKVGKLQDKAKKLEADIEITRKEMEEPTEVEVELKRRLDQMTDHLIQKQAQVESLSSEKATILFRIEAVSRMLEENKSVMSGASSRDLESGAWELPDFTINPLIKDKIRSTRKHLDSIVKQFDSVFLSGLVFLRRNPTAKVWSLVYFVCLHFWVIYILMSHSQPSNESVSGAVFSLENINNSSTI